MFLLRTYGGFPVISDLKIRCGSYNFDKLMTTMINDVNYLLVPALSLYLESSCHYCILITSVSACDLPALYQAHTDLRANLTAYAGIMPMRYALRCRTAAGPGSCRQGHHSTVTSCPAHSCPSRLLRSSSTVACCWPRRCYPPLTRTLS